jgi:polysaccharide export outer membrane protein
MDSNSRQYWAWIGLVLVLQFGAISGCSTTAGQGFTLFPAGNFLLDTTKDLRDAAPPEPDVPRELSKSVLAVYLIEPGDGLLVETEALDSPVRFPTDQTVLPDGTIDLGSYGRRMVTGKSVEQIEDLVQELVRAGGDKKTVVNVRLVQPRSAVYYVLGEVNSPGAFPLVGRETVLDGILAAGGISSRASPCNIVLSRPTQPHGCRVVLPICYRHIAQIGDTSTNYQLMPGDRIYVATRTLWEQLAFWRTTDDCEYCCGCQTACPDGKSRVNDSGSGLKSPTDSQPEIAPEPISPLNPFDDEAARTPAVRMSRSSKPALKKSAPRVELLPIP